MSYEPDDGSAPMELTCGECNRDHDHILCIRWMDWLYRVLFPKSYARNL